MEVMHKTGHLKDFDFSRLSQAYVWGCRLNHVSPFVVQKFMGSQEADGTSDFYLRQAIMFAVIFHLRLSTRYIDEIRGLSGSDVYPELASGVVALREELENMGQEDKR